MSVSEIAAVARQGWLIGARGLGLRPGPTPRGPGDGPLVAFVHGFMASGPVFDPLRARAAAAGFATTDFSYGPLARFETIAGRLAEHLHSAAEGRPLALVGHSLGGLLSRWVMQEYGVPAERLVTLATPHHGTAIARRWPTALARALRPESAVLRRLRDPEVAHLALVARHDTMVIPPESAAAPGAEVRWLDVGHNGILFDAEAHDRIMGALSAWRRERTASAAE
ncbi:MAG: hypothetical protein CMN30_21735 [Sandaracinus sp.]|nr:hypothetical protein [Sandaracinus sp.]